MPTKTKNPDPNIIDFTTWRLGKRTRGGSKIGYCPHCGRKGEITQYSDGLISINHKGRITFGGLFLHVDDHCLHSPAFRWLTLKGNRRPPVHSDTDWCAEPY